MDHEVILLKKFEIGQSRIGGNAGRKVNKIKKLSKVSSRGAVDFIG